MTKTLALFAGGTGESYRGDSRIAPSGMFGFTAKAMDPNLFEFQWVGYDAAYGNPTSMRRSSEGLSLSLIEWIKMAQKRGQRVTLSGYSQGAIGVRLAYLWARDNGALDTIAAVGNMGDPYRHPSDFIGRNPGGYGVSGQEIYAGIDHVYQAANIGDPISGADDDSLLRNIADFSADYAPGAPPEYWQAVLKILGEKSWQNYRTGSAFDFLTVPRRMKRARAELAAYLPRRFSVNGPILNPGGGRHTSYHIEKVPGWSATYCEALGRRLNEAVA